MELHLLIIGMLFIVIILQGGIFFVVFHVKKQKENEYYTDYKHNGLTLRIYKPEFEYQAIGNIPRDKLLDRGNFSQYYVWALIEN